MTKEIHDINTRTLDFVVELIDYIAEYPDDDYMTMECLCRKLHKHRLIDKKDGYYLVADGIKADRKTEPQIHGIFRKGELSDEDVEELKRQVDLFLKYTDKKKDEPQTERDER